MVHLSSHLLLSDHQYGYHKGRSCALKLIDIIDNWTKAIDKGDRIDVAFLNFIKAFDTVPTKGLLAKIQSYGIHGNNTEVADQLPRPTTSESSRKW